MNCLRYAHDNLIVGETKENVDFTKKVIYGVLGCNNFFQ